MFPHASVCVPGHLVIFGCFFTLPNLSFVSEVNKPKTFKFLNFNKSPMHHDALNTKIKYKNMTV